MALELTAVFRKVPEGYIAFVEELPGAVPQGATLEEARANPREAAELTLEANRALAEANRVKRADVIRHLAQQLRAVPGRRESFHLRRSACPEVLERAAERHGVGAGQPRVTIRPFGQGRRHSRGGDGGLTGHRCARSAEIVGRIVLRATPCVPRTPALEY
jgi:predicted RNase H-like HicB family nuclease